MTDFDDGTLHVDFVHREVTFDRKPVDLNPADYRLLATLVRHQGQVLSPEKLIELALNGLSPGRVKYAVWVLRNKLGWDEIGPIETVEGYGYRYRSKP